jgi:hypothetical protein
VVTSKAAVGRQMLGEIGLTRLIEGGSELPQPLVDALTSLLGLVYQAGRADGARQAPPEPVCDVLNRVEAAHFLRCRPTKLDGLVGRADDPVPSFLLGGRRMFRRDDLEQWLARQADRCRRVA